MPSTEGFYLDEFTDTIAFEPGRYRYSLTISSATSVHSRVTRTIRASTTFTVAPGLAIPTFHTISMADLRTSASLTQVTTFSRPATYPADTADIPFYFTWAGAPSRSTRWQIAVRTAAGDVLLRYPSHPAVLGSLTGWWTGDLVYPPSWPPGHYRLDLIVGGKLAASTATAVESSAQHACIPLSPPGPATSVLYATGPGSPRAWSGAHFSAPPRVAVVPRGSRSLAWYFHSTGNTPGVTYFQLSLTRAIGAPYLVSDVYTADCANEAWTGTFTYLPGLPAGIYQLTLTLNGQMGKMAIPVRVQ